MSQQTLCDMCRKPIVMKPKGLYFIEIHEVTDGFDNYPNDMSSDIILGDDLCSDCKRQVLDFIRKKKKEGKKAA